jgi:uncharacterized membrane protein
MLEDPPLIVRIELILSMVHGRGGFRYSGGMQLVAEPPKSAPATSVRIQSVDLLRGLVMVIMALDHIRDFFHADAFHYSPEDLSKTTGILFFTRWITHFCAPVFVFLAGVSVQLSSDRWGGRSAVSRHLVTRGLWLIFLEFTVLEFMWTFNFRYELVMLQVIWAIGWSMIVLAGLIWLPRRAVAIGAVAMMALHNTLDGVAPARFGKLALLWNILHVPTIFPIGQTMIFALYPLIPWVAVMAAGYCFGIVMQMEERRRRAILLRLGIVLTTLFLLIRFANVYGDPQRWAPQHDTTLTVISFFRTSKYPPSLDYLLMTLGPAILFLGLIDRLRVSENNPLRVFGRVPMFYYVAHFYLLHAVAVVLSGIRYGRWDYFLHFPLATTGMPDPNFPADWGYNLATVYVIWLSIVAALYFPCRWYMRVKQRSRSPWLSYL